MEALSLVEMSSAGESAFELTLLPDGLLQLRSGGKTYKVKVQRCFPWSEPLQFLSLRDMENQERLLIKELGELNEASQLVVMQAIAESQFCFSITEIVGIEEEYEMRTWQVMTEQGPRRFQTKLDDWPRHVPGGGRIIRDVHGDLYLIPRLETLPQKTQEVIRVFVD